MVLEDGSTGIVGSQVLLLRGDVGLLLR